MQSNNYPMANFTDQSFWITKETPNDILFFILSFIPIDALHLKENLNWAIFLVNKDLCSRNEAFLKTSNTLPNQEDQHAPKFIDDVYFIIRNAKLSARSNHLTLGAEPENILLDIPPSENELRNKAQLMQLIFLDNLTQFKQEERIYVLAGLDEFIPIAKKSLRKTEWLNYFFAVVTLDYEQKKNFSFLEYVKLAIYCEQTIEVIHSIFKKHSSSTKDWLNLLNALISHDPYRPDITHFIFKEYYSRFEEQFKIDFWKTLSLTIYTGDFELFQSLCEKIPRLVSLNESERQDATCVVSNMIGNISRNNLHSWLYTLLQKLPAPVFTTDGFLNKLFQCSYISLDVVKLLVNYGANINSFTSNRQDAPLRTLVENPCFSSSKDHVAVYKFLIENDADFNCLVNSTVRMIWNALNARNFELIRYFLEQQLIRDYSFRIQNDAYKPKILDFFLHAIKSGWVHSTDFILKRIDQKSLVHFPEEIKFDIATVRNTLQLEKIVTFKNHLDNLYLVTKNQYCTLMMFILQNAYFALQSKNKRKEATAVQYLINSMRENHKEKSVEQIVEEWKLSSSIFKQKTSSKNSSTLVSLFASVNIKEKVDPLMQLINELVEQSKHYIKPPSMFLAAPTTTAGVNDPNAVSTQKSSM